MTTRHKDFGSDSTIEEYEPITFALSGEVFACRAAIPGAAILRFARTANSGDGSGSAEAVYMFFERVMEPEEYARFDEFINDSDRVIRIEKLGEIVEWLVGEYTERPTQQPASSSSTTRSAGRTSTARRSAKASGSRA